MKPKRSTGPYEHIRPITREHEAAELASRARERQRYKDVPDIDFDNPPPFPGKDDAATPSPDNETPTGVYHKKVKRSVPHAAKEVTEDTSKPITQAIDVKYRILEQRGAHARANPKDADEAYADDLREIENIKESLANDPRNPEWISRLTALEKKYPPPARYRRDAG